MLKNEAIWIGKEFKSLTTAEIGKVLDLGGSTEFFRSIRQPFINRNIFTPLKKRGISIVHTDVELDVTKKDFTKKAKKMGKFNTVCAFNLLEHVTNYATAVKNISSIIPPGGYLFISCPRSFPYHPSPIDNGFRPTPTTLAALFLKANVIKRAIVVQRKIIMFTKKKIFINGVYSASCLVIKNDKT